MKIGVIIVCRMNSQRLPGKALSDIHGKPLLGRVYERLQSLTNTLQSENELQLIVATSRSWQDDPISQYCRDEKIECFRGSLSNVANRLANCSAHYQLDWFARVNGDSPFVDTHLLKEAINQAATPHFDFITNLYPRSYPYGVAVELFRSEWFEALNANQPLLIDPEHVTSRFYTNMHLLNYYNIERVQSIDSPSTAVQLTIDQPEDLSWFRQFFAKHVNDWPNITFENAVEDRWPMRRAA